MDYDFENFLHECENCSTKSDFLRRISAEKEFVLQINEPDFISRQKYLSRLDNVEFCIKHGTVKEEDVFNKMIYDLLDKLK